MGILESYYAMLSAVFGPIVSLPFPLAVAAMTAAIVFVITIFYKKMIDQSAARLIKQEMSDVKARVKELQKTNPEEANKESMKMLAASNKQMKLAMKPMLPTMIFVLLLLPWMSTVFHGYTVALPVSLPLVGNSMDWLVWYIVLSIPMNMLFKRAMGVEI